jgi:hypothetical protein
MNMNLHERIQSPTPPFFKKLRTIGLVMAAISATVLTAPVALPVVVVKVAGYLGVASMVVSAVSQSVTYEEPAAGTNDQPNGP